MSKDINKPEQLITEHIDIWTSSILAKSTSGRGNSKKYELYGITKLRELILELAVRGKLVPQDANDEPASGLLEKIAAEKTKLLEDGGIKKAKKLKKVDEDEKPFVIPPEWEWIRLGSIANTNTGYAFKSREYKDKGVFVLRVTNINQDGSIDIKDSKFISEQEASTVYKKFQLSTGDVLLVMVGGSLGKIGIVSDDVLPAVLNQNMWKLDTFGYLSRDYFIYGLRLINNNQLEITKSTHGHLSQVDYLTKLFPLPPLAEQHRIVAKVDELMLLCDQLEQQTEASIDAHATLVEVLLATLTDSTDSDELAQNWARIADHFDSLFTTEQSIEALKQTVLQLAVMGKLVPQNPGDEPASVLLEKIAEEKEQLAEQGEIRKSKSLDKVDEEEKLYDLPFNWEWTRLGDIAAVGTGATPSRTESKYWSSQDINWVSSGETSEPFIFNTKEKVSHLAIKETNVSVYPPGTLVVAMYGQGKTRGQITELKIESGTNQACAAIRLIQPDERHRYYIKLFFWKSYEEIRSNAAGGAQPNLNVSKITSTVIPLPPLAEQHRIVAKVDELMAICDQLKEKLKQSQETQVQLTDALVDRALG